MLRVKGHPLRQKCPLLKVQWAEYYFTSVPANYYPAEQRGGLERCALLIPAPTLPNITSYLANVLGPAIDVLRTNVHVMSWAV